MAPLEKLGRLSGPPARRRAPVVYRIERPAIIYRRAVFTRGLSGVRTRDRRTAQEAPGRQQGAVVAHSHVQPGSTLLEPVELRGPGVVRGAAATGVRRRTRNVKRKA